MTDQATLGVVLARGLGTRMRREDPGAVLDSAQEFAASAGLKAMIPDASGRPFIVHILASLADAGVTEACLVVAPGASLLRDYLDAHPPRRLGIAYALQAEARGTADAVLAAETEIGDRDFVVLNADNLYPVDAIQRLVTLGEPGLAAFDRMALLRDGNFSPERVAKFATLDLDANNYLVGIDEKPAGASAAESAQWISMNLWRFDRRIFTACRDVPESPRGELELPLAVAHALAQGERFRAVPVHAGVLDLSQRGDIADVAQLLAMREATP